MGHPLLICGTAFRVHISDFVAILAAVLRAERDEVAGLHSEGRAQDSELR